MKARKYAATVCFHYSCASKARATTSFSYFTVSRLNKLFRSNASLRLTAQSLCVGISNYIMAVQNRSRIGSAQCTLARRSLKTTACRTAFEGARAAVCCTKQRWPRTASQRMQVTGWMRRQGRDQPSFAHGHPGPCLHRARSIQITWQCAAWSTHLGTIVRMLYNQAI